MSPNKVRIGCGAGFSADRLDPALDLAMRGELDALVFECVGERTLAFGHRDRMQDPQRGYNPLLERRFRAVLEPCMRAGTVIITNMGVANPRAAAQRTVEVARELGLNGLKVAAIEGDDVTALMTPDTPLWEGMTIAGSGRKLVAANAYLGADPMVSALQQGAQVIITGRVADPSMFLAYLRFRFGWSDDDWQHLGAGTLVGHLLECAGQITGGYHADPGVKDVANLANLGFPLAEVDADGSAVITKLGGTGGEVTARTVKEQMFYEVHDPQRYLTPDVTADFAGVRIDAMATDRIRILGAGGSERPRQLKATVAFDGGFLAEAGVSYAGTAAVARAHLAGEIVVERMRTVHDVEAQVRVDLIGVDSLHGSAHGPLHEQTSQVKDVRLRCAMRAEDAETAGLLLWEVESLLCCGPAGGGGYRGTVTPSVITYSASVDRDAVHPTIEMLHA
ncbi:MAG: hypothetical protein ACI9DC_000540 [Gammaproteobacteria bacterium]|jgi:hypothetical protein